MTTTPGQVRFNGEVITGLKLNLAALSLETAPDGMTWDDVQALAYKDRLRLTLECVVDRTPAAGGKFDGDTGDETGAPVGIISLKPIREGVKVTAILKREAIEDAWNQAHGVA